MVSYETVRQWCWKFRPEYARNIRHRRGRLGDTWHLDELFVNIQGRRHYLWRAVDQDGDVIDILVQRHRDARGHAKPYKHYSTHQDGRCRKQGLYSGTQGRVSFRAA